MPTRSARQKTSETSKKSANEKLPPVKVVESWFHLHDLDVNINRVVFLLSGGAVGFVLGRLTGAG